MTKLHKDVQKAISSGRLEGLDQSIEGSSDDTQGFAKVVKSFSDAFEREGFSETKALKATILLINFENWKDD